MKYLQLSASDYVLKLEPDDEIVSSLKSFAQIHGYNFYRFEGIGALKNPKLGFFDVNINKYSDKLFRSDFEICSFSGNISRVDDNFAAHCHIVLSGNDYKTIGGHFLEGIVTVTVEINLTGFDKAVIRTKDEKSGLNLFDFGD